MASGTKTKQGHDRPRRSTIILVAAGVAFVAAVGGGIFAVVHGDHSAKKATAPRTLAHQFFAPECLPVQAARWVYPGPAKVESTTYESFAIHYNCAKAKLWTERLALLTVHVTKVGNPGKIEGPAGFSCEAWPDANNHAYAGGCQAGTSVAFGWNWNVANSREVLIRDPNTGQYHMQRLSGADTETILRALPRGHYRIEVLNTSGIGYLTGFTWTPPPGWTIHGLTKVTGAKCTLAAQKVTCSGTVAPPACLCAGNGGTVKIDLAVSTPPPVRIHGKIEHFGTVGAVMRITHMTAVPYLIPGTPAEAKRQQGL